MLELVGDGGYALGARAGQIRDGLRDVEQPTETDMLALQLDDRALFLQSVEGLPPGDAHGRRRCGSTRQGRTAPIVVRVGRAERASTPLDFAW